MKLNQILDILDPLSKIAVWSDFQEEDEEEPIYSGCSMDCPYYLSKLELYKGLDDGDHCISVRNDTDKSAILVISVKEPEDDTDK